MLGATPQTILLKALLYCKKSNIPGVEWHENYFTGMQTLKETSSWQALDGSPLPLPEASSWAETTPCVFWKELNLTILYFRKAEAALKSEPCAARVMLGQMIELAKFKACTAAWGQLKCPCPRVFPPGWCTARHCSPAESSFVSSMKDTYSKLGPSPLLMPDRAGPVTNCFPQLTRDLLHLLYDAQ